MMKVVLVLLEGSRRGHRVMLNLGMAVFGRARGNTVRIPSERVSRRHCRMWLERGKVWLQDLDSQNGTFLNDETVVGKVALSDGDEFTIGHVRFRVQLLRETADDGDQVPVRRETRPGAMPVDLEEADLVPLDEPTPADYDRPYDEEEAPAESFDVPNVDPADFRDILRELDEGDDD